MEHIVEVNNLHKFYGDFEALKGISFYVKQRELFALLGENGAGKSTTIDILCTIASADIGEVFVNGYACGKQDAQIRSHIGVVFQCSMLDDLLSVEDNLMTRCGFYQLYGSRARRRVEELCRAVDIWELRKQKTATLSGGQRRRVDIARALIPKPSLLILDEPTTGLDPSSRKQIWNTITNLQKSLDMSVVLTTHYMEEARHADHICMMKKGQIVAHGSPQQLRERYAKDHLYLYTDMPKTLAKQLSMLQLPFYQTGNSIHVFVSNSAQAFSILKRAEHSITSFEMIKGTMDEVFLSLMKEGE